MNRFSSDACLSLQRWRISHKCWICYKWTSWDSTWTWGLACWAGHRRCLPARSWTLTYRLPYWRCYSHNKSKSISRSSSATRSRSSTFSTSSAIRSAVVCRYVCANSTNLANFYCLKTSYCSKRALKNDSVCCISVFSKHNRRFWGIHLSLRRTQCCLI